MADNFSVEDKDKNSLAKDVPSPVTISQLTPNTIYSGWLATKNDGDATLAIPDQTTLPSKPSMTLTPGAKQFTANVKLATGDGSAPITKAVISYKNGDNDAKTKEFDKPMDLSSLVVDGLADGTDYDATVVVSNASGDSGASDSVSVTTDSAKIAVTGVKFVGESTNINVGETKNIIATVSPDDATNKALKYSSSDTTVATIDADSGSAKGVKAGSVTITATSVDDTSKKATVTLNVQTPTVNVTGITADKSLTVQVGKTAKINAVITPDNATNKGVIYKSADPTLATVDADGTVHGIKATDPGKTVQITATSYADGSKIATTAVTVTTAS